jgi:hypothetical protein
MEDRFRGAEQCWKISGPDVLAKSRGLLAVFQNIFVPEAFSRELRKG